MEKTYQEALVWAKKKHKKDVSFLTEKRCPKTAQCQKRIDDIQHFHRNEKREKILVFISFSMPLQSLKSLTDEGSKHNATFVLRGLKENSFKKTMSFMKDHQLASNIDINPPLFTRYTITKVPAFILLKDEKEIARLFGNVSLSFAVSKLRGEL
jgi:type-F conjugative transfer system pilin assembly protein TrbC